MNSLDKTTETRDAHQTSSTFSVGSPPPVNTCRILGVNWNTDTDQFYFDLHEVVALATSSPPTKQSVLKLAARIFYPFGCLSLFVIKMKILFQELCAAKAAWGEQLTGVHRVKFDSFIAQLNSFQNVRLYRYLFDRSLVISSIQIHAFSDASERAYASVVYLRTVYASGAIDLKFLASKAKVSPLNKQTIPRLDLLGAYLMAKHVDTIRATLGDELYYGKLDTLYWVDSVAALY